MHRKVIHAILMAVPVVVLGFAGSASAQNPASTFEKQIIDSLKDVHNHGADLYNQAKDYNASFRVYEGALMTVKPLLSSRPAVQKAIENGFAAANSESDPAKKAFLLHQTIEQVRTELRGSKSDNKPADPKAGDPKPIVPQPVQPKSQEKANMNPEKESANVKKQIKCSGKILIEGQRVVAGKLTFVSTDLPLPRVVTTNIKDGTATEVELDAGNYKLLVEGDKVPSRYFTTDTTPISLQLKPGLENIFQFDLKRP